MPKEEILSTVYRVCLFKLKGTSVFYDVQWVIKFCDGNDILCTKIYLSFPLDTVCYASWNAQYYFSIL